jgi:signal transduction histidine kinase
VGLNLRLRGADILYVKNTVLARAGSGDVPQRRTLLVSGGLGIAPLGLAWMAVYVGAALAAFLTAVEISGFSTRAWPLAVVFLIGATAVSARCVPGLTLSYGTSAIFFIAASLALPATTAALIPILPNFVDTRRRHTGLYRAVGNVANLVLSILGASATFHLISDHLSDDPGIALGMVAGAAVCVTINLALHAVTSTVCFGRGSYLRGALTETLLIEGAMACFGVMVAFVGQQNLLLVPVGLGAAVVLERLLHLPALRERAAVGERERDHEQRRRHELEELNTLREAFVSMVVHDLRTPLTSVLGYSDLLLEGEGGEVSPEQLGFLAVIKRNANHLLALVDDLLVASRAASIDLDLTPQAMDLADLVDEAHEAALPAATEKNIALTSEVKRPLAIHGDNTKLRQVVTNLLSNAIKFTPQGGKVEFIARSDDHAVVLIVKDSGIGIRADELPRLFERFFRASSAREAGIHGNGIGLHVAKAVVEAHGGGISVESSPGAGSTFTVRLPAASGNGATGAQTGDGGRSRSIRED